MKHNLNAIGFAVRDMRRMVEFYRDVIGFDLHWDGGSFASTQTHNRAGESGVFFNLYQRPADDSGFLNPLTYPAGINGAVQITCDVFAPEDVDREYARLIQAGAAPIVPPTTQPWGMRVCFVADPEGNQIEICALLED